MQEIKNIVLIGAGNVATQMGHAFQQAGLRIVQVWSRTRSAAEKLARELGADPAIDLASLLPDADLYILSVSDDAIPAVLEKMDARGKFIVHTSGSVSIGALEPYSGENGVIYPLQTFSKTRQADFNNIPLCIEASSLNRLEVLHRLVSKISRDVRSVSSEQRQVIHLAAVFACNFPNFMFSVAASILQSANLDFDLIKPLILETAEKAIDTGPGKAQTGPAWRGDKKIMNKHLEMLSKHPENQDLYEKISQAIGNMKMEHNQ